MYAEIHRRQSTRSKLNAYYQVQKISKQITFLISKDIWMGSNGDKQKVGDFVSIHLLTSTVRVLFLHITKENRFSSGRMHLVRKRGKCLQPHKIVKKLNCKEMKNAFYYKPLKKKLLEVSVLEFRDS